MNRRHCHSKMVDPRLKVKKELMEELDPEWTLSDLSEGEFATNEIEVKSYKRKKPGNKKTIHTSSTASKDRLKRLVVRNKKQQEREVAIMMDIAEELQDRAFKVEWQTPMTLRVTIKK